MRKVAFITIVTIFSISIFSCCKKKTTTNNNNNTVNDIVVEKNYFGLNTMDATDSMFFAALGGVTIPASSPILLDTFATKVDVTLAPYGVTKDKIKSVTATSLSLEITNNPGQLLDFMDTVRIYIDSFNGNTPKLLAYKNAVPLGLRTLALDVITDDFKNYFKADFCKILLGGHVRSGYPIKSGTEFKYNCGFRITATP